MRTQQRVRPRLHRMAIRRRRANVLARSRSHQTGECLREIRSPESLDEIEVQIIGRFVGRLRGFRVRLRGKVLVLEGRVRSYHVKQLVREAVVRLAKAPVVENAIEVV